MKTARRITLTQLRELNHRAYTLLRKVSLRHTFTYAIVTDGKSLVAKVDDVSLTWDGAAWKVVPQPWMTLKTYAAREGITLAEAHNRWRKHEIPGAYNVRGQVVVPA